MSICYHLSRHGYVMCLQVGRKVSDVSLARDGFRESCLILKHVDSVTKIHFNAFDALAGWKQEALCPVEVPATAN